MSSERGVTLVEMLVTMAFGMVVILAGFALTDVSLSNSARVQARVDADQKAKPVMQRLIDELHSACIGVSIAPVLTGSTSSSISFLHRTGSAVTPIPDKRVVTLTGSTLTESVYPSTGGEAPTWTFSGTASSTRTLLTGVGLATAGSPPSSAPVFQYFSDSGGALSTTPLPVPLSAADAARAIQVKVSFSVSPQNKLAYDPNSAVSVSDSALLRFSPFSEALAEANGPCE